MGVFWDRRERTKCWLLRGQGAGVVVGSNLQGLREWSAVVDGEIV